MLKTRLFSPLVKFVPGLDVESLPEYTHAAAARGENFAFQLAMRSETEYGEIKVEASCDALPVSVRKVELIQSRFPGERFGGDVITEEPGLFADLLAPLPEPRTVSLSRGMWTIVYISGVVSTEAVAGDREIHVKLTPFVREYSRWGDTPLHRELSFVFTLTVDPLELDAPGMLRLEWMHWDWLAKYYRVVAWSEPHWQIVENFIANAAAHGVSVLFTTLWTPPLNTGIGLERPDCQLLDIAFDPETGKYTFDFGKLERYLGLGLKYGFAAFAMSHIFTQWGARFAPKIKVTLPDGSVVRRFGWDTPADGGDYQEFLRQLFPALLPILRKTGGKCFFSLSDEPKDEDFEHYRGLVGFIRPLLEEFETVEAMSHLSFYRAGLVRRPVADLTAIEEFRGAVPELAGYYCVGDGEYTNRFFKMPLRRTRIFGVLSYVYDLKFFLHWGYNYYSNQYSTRLLNPFHETDADGVYPSGDAFLVYPGDDFMPWDSLRGEAFRDGLTDRRYLELLEKKIGRNAVLELVCQDVGYELTMKTFPDDDGYLLDLRAKVRRALLGHRS